MKKKIIVCVDNHFDQMWRRCFEKRFTHKGDSYASYAEIEAYYILDNMKLARKHADYRFQIEGVITVQKFLERHPELTGELQELHKAGRMYIAGSGYSIIDSNLSSGESLIRNYLLGTLWLKKTFGTAPKLCVRNDAFGNSAQMPQILRGTGFSWVSGLSYAYCKGDYWVGLDGSTVCQKSLPSVGTAGGWIKYAPCTNCHGTGKAGDKPCHVCGGRGLDFEKSEAGRQGYRIQEENFGSSDCAFFRVGGEELLPVEKTVSWVHSLTDRYDISFGCQEDAYPYVAEEIEAEMQGVPGEQGDLNPVCTGCYVTRIKTKQAVRRQGYALEALEALVVMAYLKTGQAPREKLNALWQKLLFQQFHDAITGTHVDPAYEELQEISQALDAELQEQQEEVLHLIGQKNQNSGLTIINPTGLPYTGLIEHRLHKKTEVLPGAVTEVARVSLDKEYDSVKLLVHGIAPFSAYPLELVAREETESTVLPPAASEEPVSAVLGTPPCAEVPHGARTAEWIENDRYKILADEHGLVDIYDKWLGRSISTKGAYRPAEFVLEHDEGSPWATLNANGDKYPLSAYTTLLAVRKTDYRHQLQFHTSLPMYLGCALNSTEITWTAALTKGLSQVEIAADVEWHNFNRRLRIVFPVSVQGEHLYEIPYGLIPRKEYTPWYGWTGANGDWAAKNWAGVSTKACSVAVLNRGTPSYRLQETEDGSLIQLSLLRSPTTPTYLHETNAYSMTEWDGMRDEGIHHFECALVSFSSLLIESDIVPIAEAYNTIPVVTPLAYTAEDMPALSAAHTRLASVKLAEDKSGIILRLAEYAGKEELVEIRIPATLNKAEVATMLEVPQAGLNIVGGTLQLRIRPFQICTVKLSRL